MVFVADFKGMHQNFDVKFSEIEQSISPDFGDIQKVVVPPESMKYEGEYDVTPKVDSQSLPTAQKFLEQDVTVRAIPFYKVSNTSGGATIYIGNEV